MFILSSSGDGVWDEISDEHAVSLVKDALSKNDNVSAAAATLRDAAYLMGSDDNISVIIIRLSKPTTTLPSTPTTISISTYPDTSNDHNSAV